MVSWKETHNLGSGPREGNEEVYVTLRIATIP